MAFSNGRLARRSSDNVNALPFPWPGGPDRKESIKGSHWGQSGERAKERGGLAPPAALLRRPLVATGGRRGKRKNVPSVLRPSLHSSLHGPIVWVARASRTRHPPHPDAQHTRDTTHTTHPRHTRQVPGPGPKLSTHRSSLTSRQRPHGYAGHHMFLAMVSLFFRISTPSTLV